ncbi:thioredoxin domain-containing protein [Nocardioides sp. YIM 152315]|uniref:DsbA family protein n=1 Tax=Nocardioides sp. YIM 152315 TaxID=3031760 RepID=UPI0023DBB266|nr:thioredoxin domain-containing protein [Nocardioides sp. YIM 152315]MDF1606413.1 thioredoxin domain-containing protein [Nocardioides sp. YIM 152315]
MSKKNRANDRAARAAAALAEQQRQERRRRNLMVGGVIAGIVVIVLAGWLLSRSLDTTKDVDAPAAGSEFGLTIGPGDAPNKIVIYEDFLCPYCGELERTTRDDLARLAGDGEVQVEYRPFNLLGGDDDTSYSVRASGAFSIVLEESGPEVAKEFHDLLFENQPSERGPFPESSELADLAVEAGADDAAVRAAIEGDEGSDWVDRATSAATEAGVNSTPTVLLNGEVFQEGRTAEDLGSALVERVS